MKTFNSITYSSHRCRAFAGLAAALTLLWANASDHALAVEPPPGGGYPNNNTALGDGALSNNAPGFDNTGIGFNALMSVTSAGAENTAIGSNTLSNTTTGLANVALGFQALFSSTTGRDNVAVGFNALVANTTGTYNVAIGEEALQARTNGGDNVAVGPGAMALGTSGNYNTAIGSTAMAFANGSDNVAVGDGALNAASGDENIGIGQQACLNCSGDNNIAIGEFAGQKVTMGASNILLGQNAGLGITTGSNNIEIATQGEAADAGMIRIGTRGKQTATFIAGIKETPLVAGAAVAVGITADGKLGVRASSARFKEAIKPMDKTSEAVLALKPVTFHYKKAFDPSGIPQFGLVAEEVAQVDPDLVIRDEKGRPFSVRYDEVNTMLLNEFLKEHKKVEALEVSVAKLQAQGQEIAELKAALAKQAQSLRKVSAQVEANTPAARLVENR